MKRKRNPYEEKYTHSNNNNNNDNKKMRVEVEENSILDHLDEQDLDTTNEEGKEEFVLTKEIAENAILSDISGDKWKLGSPIGKGSFGEIFLASDDITRSVDVSSAHYVTKIEPHLNGPLFVEIHCLLNVNKHTCKLRMKIFLSYILKAFNCSY